MSSSATTSKSLFRTWVTTLGLAACLLPLQASAFELTYSVNSSSYDVAGNESASQLITAFDNSTPVYCSNEAISNYTNIGSNALCGSGNSNLAYLTELSFSLADTTDIDFRAGMDWGRGGAVLVDGNMENMRTDDIWWGYNWASSDVIETNLTLSGGTHMLQWIGFENCCNGLSSIQFRVEGGSWQALSEANFSQYEGTPAAVPVPPALALFALGLALMGRRFS
jgi:hypothetical protein